MFIRSSLILAVGLVGFAGGASAGERVMAYVAKPQIMKMVIVKPKRMVGFLCPEGWVPATPPLNPQLGCMSNTLTLGN